VRRHLTAEQALAIARTAVGGPINVRDVGLVEAAVRRPRAAVLRLDAYPDPTSKAAALLHSLATTRPLTEGNERLAWLATVVFLAKNDLVVDAGDDEAFKLVTDVASGQLDEVGDIAAVLATFTSA
jgi:death-on-curing protein